MATKLKTIYIVGPTASGKTALSVDVAKQINAEIICADSQTVKKMMNIGTAKPTKEEMAGVAHHLIDIIEPYEEFSVYDFKNRAQNIVVDIKGRNKHVIIVGGTGLYIDALYFDYALTSSQSEFTRDDLSNYSVQELQQMIIDRGLARPVNWQNPRHLIGTLLRGGDNSGHGTPNPDSIIVGLYPGRDVLVDRISARVEEMFNKGFVEEVRSIVRTYGEPPKAFDAIGYKIVMRHLKGEITVERAKELFAIADRQYAKRQMSWFRRNPDIVWFATPDEAKAYILERA